MTTGISDIVLYLSLAFVVLWTMRLARSKGRNPYLWGGLSLALMLIPSWPALLGMAPMIILLFMKSPQVAPQDVKRDTVNCPKCRAVHAAGHTYCVNCGWELGKPYLDEAPREETARKPEETTGASPTTGQPGPSSQPKVPETPAGEPLQPVAEVPPEATPGAPVENAPAAGEAAAAPAPAFRRPITPATFTERGLALFNQGKFQEAVDQFTKAIALDPKYVPAWARRAEAYVRLGRDNKAEEDRRHLDGLRGQPSS